MNKEQLNKKWPTLECAGALLNYTSLYKVTDKFHQIS